MASSLALTFDVLARDNASKTFRNVGDAAEKAGKQGNAAGSAISSGMKLAAGALLGGGLIAGFKALYDAAAESQRISRLTEQVVRSTGGAANVTAKQVGDLANAISRKTGIDDEAIQSGENLLLTFTNVRNEVGKGNDIFDQATATITDMSVALGQDTSSSAIQLGKALNDPIKGVTALQRVGVSFTASQKEQIATLVETGHTLDAQKIILRELSTEFGGAAAAAATPFDKLKVTLGNLAEEAGNHLIPIVDGLANFLMDDLLPAAGNLAPVFSAAGDVLRVVADLAGDVLDFFNGLPGPVKATAIALGAVTILKGPLRDLFSGIRGLADTAALKMLYFKDAIGSISGATGAAKAGASGLVGFLGGPWGIAIAGATLGISLLVDWLGKSDDQTQASKQATQDYADALREASGVINDNVREAAAKAAQDAGLLDVADNLGISLSSVTDAITGQGSAYDSVRGRLEAFIAQHTTATGRSAQFGTTLDAEGQAAQGALTQLDALAGQGDLTAASQEQLAQAVADGGAAAGAAVLSQEQLMTQLQDTADAAGDARSQTDLFKQSLDILTGQHVSLLEVQANFQESLARATDALKDEGGAVLTAAGALNLQSENGRITSDVLVGIRGSANDLIGTMIQQGATTEAVQAKDAELRQSFYNTALQMTGSKEAAQKLTDSIYGIPSERNTTITADTGPARAQLNQFVKDFTGYQINAGLVLGRNQLAAADGGFIAGPGTGRSDSIPAWLSNGEFVVNAASTKVFRPVLEAMNASRKGYADGGIADVRDFMSYMITRFGISPSSIASVASQLRASVAVAAPGAPAATGSNQAIVQSLAASMYGWTGAQWNALYALIMKESGFRNTAQNPTSTAYGMFQFLDSTWAGYGVGKTSDPRLQTVAGLRYIASRYGSPASALSFHLAHGWYDKGGWLQPGLTLAYNGTGKPERVVGPGDGGGPFVGKLYLDSGQFLGVVRGQIAQDRYRQGVNARSS